MLQHILHNWPDAQCLTILRYRHASAILGLTKPLVHFVIYGALYLIAVSFQNEYSLSHKWARVLKQYGFFSQHQVSSIRYHPRREMVRFAVLLRLNRYHTLAYQPHGPVLAHSPFSLNLGSCRPGYFLNDPCSTHQLHVVLQRSVSRGRTCRQIKPATRARQAISTNHIRVDIEHDIDSSATSWYHCLWYIHHRLCLQRGRGSVSGPE